MVKRCKVVLNNALVTVVKVNDSKLVQLPAIGADLKEVNLLHENGKYRIVADDYIERPASVAETIEQPRKRAAKKTTIMEETVSDEEAIIATDEE